MTENQKSYYDIVAYIKMVLAETIFDQSCLSVYGFIFLNGHIFDN